MGSAEAMEAYRRIKKFMTSDELGKFTDLIHKNTELFSETLGRGTLGPRYRVVNGDQLRSQMPEIGAYGEQRVHPIVEHFAGEPLRPMDFSKRSMRIQLYEKKTAWLSVAFRRALVRGAPLLEKYQPRADSCYLPEAESIPAIPILSALRRAEGVLHYAV